MRVNAIHGALPRQAENTPAAGMARERSRRGPARKSLAERLWSRVEKTASCWLWTGHVASGYGRISVGGRNAPMVAAHRAAWTLVNGPIPDEMYVCHRCDVPRCVNPEHLFLGTQTDNMRDCANKGRLAPRAKTMNVGETNGRAKLTRTQVEEIRTDPATAAKVAVRFGVSKATVHAIRQGRIWRSLAA